MITARSLTKFYGDHRGVEDLDFEVGSGEIFGFLGPNGAGKTTTIRLLLDFIRPSRGTVRVFGADPAARPTVRAKLGYLPGDLRLYDRLTGRELLAYLGRLRGMATMAPATHLAERLDLELDRPLRSLSRGNRQKLGIVQALMHEPELAVLDEPTSGLDPLVQQTFYELLAEARAAGRTVFLSSHVLSEVQHVADRVALLREGRLMLVDTIEALRARATGRVEATFAEAPPPDVFAELPGVREVSRRGAAVRFALTGEVDPLVKALSAFRVLALESREADLEDVFLSLYRGDDGVA